MPFSRHDHPPSSAYGNSSANCFPWPTDLLSNSNPTSASCPQLFFYHCTLLHYVVLTMDLCNHCSDFAPVHSGVPQGSVLGPILSPCILSLCLPLLTHSIIHHSFADDLQLQMSAPPDRISELLHSMQSCISDVKAWATANMLKLNDSKTELMLVTSKRSKHLHNLPTSITIGNAQIPFKQSVKIWVLHWNVILL